MREGTGREAPAGCVIDADDRALSTRGRPGVDAAPPGAGLKRQAGADWPHAFSYPTQSPTLPLAALAQGWGTRLLAYSEAFAF